MTRPADQGPVANGRPSPRLPAAMGLVAALVAALALPSLTAAREAVASDVGSGAGGPQAAAAGGSLLAWGDNQFGQLGNDTTIGSDTPVKVQLPAGTRVISMRAGCGHTLALTSTGHVLAWGYNGDGELGDGTTTSTGTPVKVKLPPGTTVTAVRAGCFHSLALTTTGHVLAWGFSGQGELGNGSTLSSLIPVRVKLPRGTKVRAISAGSGHSLATTATGRLYAWGANSGGQLGDGTTINRDTPVKVKLPKGTVVTLTAAGEGQSLARTSTGKVLAWGDNTDGALGNGSTTSSLTAVRVLLPRHTKVRALFGGCAECGGNRRRASPHRCRAWSCSSSRVQDPQRLGAEGKLAGAALLSRRGVPARRHGGGPSASDRPSRDAFGTVPPPASSEPRAKVS